MNSSGLSALWVKARLTYGTLEIVHAIDSNAYRSVPFTLGVKWTTAFPWSAPFT
jgi:hypothetical protein